MESSSTPSGLELLDTGSWTWRELDPQATFVELGKGSLVAYEQPVTGFATAAVYDLAGNIRFRVSGVFQVSVASRTAYASGPGGTTARLDVLDAGTGRLLRREKDPGFTLIRG